MRWGWLPLLGLIACTPQNTPPRISSVTPRIATIGEIVTIRGADFQAGLSLKLSGVTVIPTVVTVDTVQFAMPARDIGESDVTLTNPDGGFATNFGPALLGLDDEDVVRGSVFVTFDASVTLETARQIASNQGFTLESFTPSDGSALGVCGNAFAEYQDARGRSTAQAINDLEVALKQLNPRYEADPKSALTGSDAPMLRVAPAQGNATLRFTKPPNLETVRVAVLDTGVSNHPSLGALEPGRNFTRDDNPADPRALEDDVSDLGLYAGATMGHGTGVAALVAGQLVPTTPPAPPSPPAPPTPIAVEDTRGIAAGVKLLPVKVCSSLNGRNLCLGSDVVRGVCHAIARRADVINLSLGGRQPMRSLRNVLLEASRQGITVVTAAGNRGLDDPQPTHYPAAYSLEIPGLIAVGAARDDGFTVRGAAFSSSGPWVSVAATAAPIRTATVTESGVSGFGEADLEGTSFAAPQVTAVAALLRAQHPEWTPEQIKARVVQSAKPTPTCPREKCGAGLIDPEAALQP
jgi:subtilisin family serine protease